MPRYVLIIAGLLASVAWPSAAPAQPSEGSSARVVLYVALRDEAITPATARYLLRGIRRAHETNAECLVISLDTPGGLVDSTRTIVKQMLASDVPVVVYVAPSGARAASAGVFITLAANVAAMAPGTNIGAAHPVQLGGIPIPSEPAGPPSAPAGGDRATPAATQPSTQPAGRSPGESKIVNDTVAWARSLAELRGRNADWAVRAVRESVSVTASEAARQNVIDLVADDLEALLAQLDGREVTLPERSVRLHTRDAKVQTLEMSWADRVLAALSSPNLAFLLLLLGFYGILFELYTPGWGVAGTLGALCLILAFFGLAILPINYVGLLLIVAALALFVAEAFVTSFGALTVAGVACLILGGLMLVESPTGVVRVSLAVVIPAAAATALITVFLVGNVVRAHRLRVATGDEAMMGSRAVAQGAFSREGERYAGAVFAHGELWKAVSLWPIEANEGVEVQDREGLTLHVSPVGDRDV